MPKRFEDGLGYLIHHLMYALRQRLAEQCAASGYPITADELALLMIVYQSGDRSGLSQKELGDTLAKDKAVITRLINSLSSKDLVVRSSDEKDRRVMRVCLTKVGKKAAETLHPGLIDILSQAYSGISQEEFMLARDVLGRMLKNVRESSCK
ncbi:transcriptional regulator, MarR family [Mariprofundus ferrinatatus]|uniref:Transcriptional regulator, MarR family n=2 Tax=Mariprofundus ferrinatatus TaxID=1921087 RepID=A0A2K8LDW2_9PROT|nr:transcriptional regulator, MarR family [Mariprofundus ferrinatatus]